MSGHAPRGLRRLRPYRRRALERTSSLRRRTSVDAANPSTVFALVIEATLLVGCASPNNAADSTILNSATSGTFTQDSSRFDSSIADTSRDRLVAKDRLISPRAAAVSAPAGVSAAETGLATELGANPASPETLAPGLYALDRLAIATSGTTATIRAPYSCTRVLDELQAGQWTMLDIPADQNALGVTMALLSYGDRLGTLYLGGTDTACAGSLTMAQQADVTTSGALVTAKSATELPLYCHAGPDPNGQDLSDLQLAYFGLFITPAGSFVLNFSGPAKKGTNRLDVGDEGDQGVMVLPIKADVAPIDAALNFVGKFFSGTDSVDDAFADFAGAFSGAGTLTVTSTDPLTATLSTDGLPAHDGSDEEEYDDEDDAEGTDAGSDLTQYAGQTLTLTASLHCDQ